MGFLIFLQYCSVEQDSDVMDFGWSFFCKIIYCEACTLFSVYIVGMSKCVKNENFLWRMRGLMGIL